MSKPLHVTGRLGFEGAVDADGHILEPPDLWETYLEPKYRDRALRLRLDENGLEELEIGGERSKLSRGGFPSTLGAMGDVRIEFTIEPFVDGNPGPHVLAAWRAIEAHGCELVAGPFSSTVDVATDRAHERAEEPWERAHWWTTPKRHPPCGCCTTTFARPWA